MNKLAKEKHYNSLKELNTADFRIPKNKLGKKVKIDFFIMQCPQIYQILFF